MKGDFSRFSFDPHKHYTAVRMQQGRVQLDADWNEQVDILRYEMETHLKDLIGSGGGPAQDLGFEIRLDRPFEESGAAEADHTLPDFRIGAGRYYVDGVRCENEQPIHFSRQPDFPGASLPEEASPDERYMVYLDVWQRHLTAIEEPEVREVALGGPDTTTRTRTVWQVRLVAVEAERDGEDGEEDVKRDVLDEWQAFVELATAAGRMRARRTRSTAALENQLYRVEVHSVDSRGVTFKWSRNNGSVAFAVTGIQAGAGEGRWMVGLAGLERDPLALKPGDWVELADDDSALNGRAWPLCQVETVDAAQGQVLLKAQRDLQVELLVKPERHPLLRRWDQSEARNGALVDGALSLEEDRWIGLEDGIEVHFSPDGRYHTGDYWTIPARTLTGGIEWPQGKNGPLPRPPQGIRHRYSLLALLGFREGEWQVMQDFRRMFVPAPVVDSEDFSILKDLRTDRAVLHKIENALAEMQAAVEELRRGQGRERERLFQDMRSADFLEEGEVVSLDPERRNHVMRANRDNETLVLGVVSEVFDEMEEGAYRVRVITYGRVRAKVLGAVRPGDMLVPSERNGFAHKGGVIIRPGALIGKALQAHEPGEQKEAGRIEMFVLLG